MQAKVIREVEGRLKEIRSVFQNPKEKLEMTE